MAEIIYNRVELRNLIMQWRSDSSISRVGSCHMAVIDSFNLHEGHMKYFQDVISHMDVSVLILIPNIPMETFNLVPLQDDISLKLDNEILKDLPLDYVYLPIVEKEEYNSIITRIPRFYLTGEFQERFHIMTTVRMRLLFEGIDDKLFILDSKKDVYARLSRWNCCLQWRARVPEEKRLLRKTFPLLQRHWLTPLHRDVDGLLYEKIPSSSKVYQWRLMLRQALVDFNGSDLRDLISNIPVAPEGYVLDVNARDLYTLKLFDKLFPKLGVIYFNLISDRPSNHKIYQDILFIGMDESKWFDLINLRDLEDEEL